METKIRQFRQEKGITQQQLADLVGVTRQTINALENARYNPSLLLAYHITNILGKDAIEDVFIFSDDDCMLLICAVNLSNFQLII